MRVRTKLKVLALASCAALAAMALALAGCGGGASGGSGGAGSTTTGESYRVVSVDEHNGESSLTRGGGEVIALYDGLNLQSGDDVVTGSGADATLAVDSDKYLYAEENTHFWLEAEGREGSSRTSIHVEDGSVLFRLDTKLNAAESFQVSTPNATMSIRGTCGVVEYVDVNKSRLYLLEGQVTLGSGSQTTTIFGGQTATIILRPDDNSGQNQQQEKPGASEATISVKPMTEKDYGPLVLTTGEGLKPATVEKILEFSVDSGKTMSFGDKKVTPKRAEKILNNVKAGKTTAPKAINNLSKTTAAAEHEHAYTRTVEQAATCTANGTARYSCACGASYTEIINALGHKSVKTARQEPTCTSSGLTAGSKCSRCDAVLSGQKEIPAKGHGWQLASVDVEPTCLEAGVSTYRCDGCGLTYTEYPAALGHDMVDDPEVPATCTTAGKTAGQHCSRCDYTTGGEEIAKLPHTYNYYGYCTNCNTYSPAHDNSYYEPTVPDDSKENEPEVPMEEQKPAEL